MKNSWLMMKNGAARFGWPMVAYGGQAKECGSFGWIFFFQLSTPKEKWPPLKRRTRKRPPREASFCVYLSLSLSLSRSLPPAWPSMLDSGQLASEDTFCARWGPASGQNTIRTIKINPPSALGAPSPTGAR